MNSKHENRELQVQRTIHRPQSRLPSWLLSIGLVSLTFAAYLPIFHAGLIDLDDNTYITENTHLRDGSAWDKIDWAFTARYASNWHPITWLSLMLDTIIFEGNVRGYHLVNLLLHCLNALLVFWLFRCLVHLGIGGTNARVGGRQETLQDSQSGTRKTKGQGKRRESFEPSSSTSDSSPRLWACAFGAALFAIHPLHVESVAWVAERKDVLSTFFFLLTLLAYIRFLLPVYPFRRSALPSYRFAIRYLLILFLYALGLMSKPMIVTLPILIILIHYSQSFRFNVQGEKFIPGLGSISSIFRLVLVLLPLFALAAASCTLTIWAQKNAISSLELIPFHVRVSNAVVTYIVYILKMLWPVRLSVFYPHPGVALPQYQVWLSAGVLALISWSVARLARIKPYLAFGWLWYIITLLPVIGIIQVGAQSMANRYTYIPLIGLFLVLALGVPDLFASLSRAKNSDPGTSKRHVYALPLLAGLSAIVILALLILAFQQVQLWQNSVTLFSHAVKLNDGNYVAHSSLGAGLLRQGHLESAADHFLRAVKIRPNYALAWNNLGTISARQGRYDEAVAYYRRAVELRPDNIPAWNDLAELLANQGKLDEAIDTYRKALGNQPHNPLIMGKLGLALYRKGDLAQAIEHFAKALVHNPDDWEVQMNMGNAFQRAGQPQQAIDHLSIAVGLKPDIPEVHVNLGISLGTVGRHEDAVRQFKEAVRLAPKSTDAQMNLGVALFKLGRLDEAITHLSIALEISPGDPSANKNMAVALYYRGRYADAWSAVRQSLEHGITPDPQFLQILSQKMSEPR